jgi:hypothetical protein
MRNENNMEILAVTVPLYMDAVTDLGS